MTTKRTDLAGAARAIDALVARLSDPNAVQDAVGLSTVDQVRARGAATSSPRQAHLVAGSFRYQDGAIALDAYARAGKGVAGDLVFGAEFGSEGFRQFGPRHSGGTWLFPTIRELPAPVIVQGEKAVDQLIQDAL